jgi:hypothetical protein
MPAGTVSSWPHTANRAPGTRDLHRGGDGLLKTNALEHRIDSESIRQFAHVFDRLLTALAHDVGRAELFRQRNPLGITTEKDDLFGA